MKRPDGFTLVELLMAMAIAVALMVLALQLMQSTNRITQSSIVTSAGIQNVQQAANVVADDVRRALTIESPGNTTSLGSGAPGAPSETGADMLVLISAPLAGSRCTTPFEYISYYFVDRSTVASGGEWLSLNSDPSNNDKQVMLQYSACSDTSDPTTAVLTSELLRVATDYLGEASFDYDGFKNRRVTITLTAAQTLAGRTVTGQEITTVAVARNIF